MFQSINKKFFNIDAPEVASAPAQQSIAELMASKGQMNTTETFAAPVLQNSIPEKKEEPAPATTEATPVATTNDATQEAATANQESPKPTEEAKPTVEAPIETKPEVPTLSWQEVLKQQPEDDVLKTLGLDASVVSLSKELKDNPQMLAFYQHWKSNGDVQAYLRELTTDYTKMPAEEVMRHQLKQEYPKATQQQLDALYKREVIKAYSLDSDDEDERNEGVALLEAKADKYRDVLVGSQKNFLLPKPPEPKAAEQPDNREQAVHQEIEAQKSFVKNDPYIRDIFQNKKFSIGEGDDRFSFQVDPEEVLETIYNPDKFTQALFDVSQKEGKTVATPKTKEQFLAGMILKYPNFLSEYAQHYKNLGGKAAIAPIDNAKPLEQSAAVDSTPKLTTPAEIMAKSGRLV
jgi:hypothetical protein